MPVKHYYYFDQNHSASWNGGKLDKEKWEELRNDGKDSNFAISGSISEYEKRCSGDLAHKEAAEAVVDVIREKNWQDRRIVSMGSGTGALEWHIKQLNPQLHVECTDYTSAAMERLKKVFPSIDDAYEFDMLEGDYSAFATNSVLVFHRLSNEFDPEQWKTVFAKMKEGGVKDIIFTPCEVVNPIVALKETLAHIKNRLLGRRDTFCGWMYSEKELMDIFGVGGYTVRNSKELSYTNIYLLQRESL